MHIFWGIFGRTKVYFIKYTCTLDMQAPTPYMRYFHEKHIGCSLRLNKSKKQYVADGQQMTWIWVGQFLPAKIILLA